MKKRNSGSWKVQNIRAESQTIEILLKWICLKKSNLQFTQRPKHIKVVYEIYMVDGFVAESLVALDFFEGMVQLFSQTVTGPKNLFLWQLLYEKNNTTYFGNYVHMNILVGKRLSSLQQGLFKDHVYRSVGITLKAKGRSKQPEFFKRNWLEKWSLGFESL